MVATNSAHVWDVCCDHGIIGQSFSSNNQNVYYLDQVKSIIDNLKTTDIPLANIFLQDARKFKWPRFEEKTSYIICGIGGELAVEILDNLMPYLKIEDQIVLSPHNNILTVREYLQSSKLLCSSEVVLKDNNKYYEIFDLSLSGTTKVAELPGAFWPLNTDTHEYIQQMLSHYLLKSKYSKDSVEIADHLKKLNDAYKTSLLANN